MSDLNSIRCVGCEGGIPVLTQQEVKTYLSQVKEWEVSEDGKSIRKRFTFKGFYKTMAIAFTNAIVL